MILIDFNQCIFSAMHSYSVNNKNFTEKEFKYVVINTLHNFTKRFKHDYGKIVICFDSRTYWRRKFFPYYKSGRKKARESSPLNFELIFKVLNTFKYELIENFPFKFLEVDGAECDDIIGILVKKYYLNEKIMIVSGDRDFLQLHQYLNVKQYSPITGVFLKSQNPFRDLKEKIIRGEGASGDAIPSILSPDNIFQIEKRQSPISSKKLEEWLKLSPEEFCNEEMLKNYERNRTLIDFDYIPNEIMKEIINRYDNTEIKGSRQKIYKYFVKNKYIELLDLVQEF